MRKVGMTDVSSPASYRGSAPPMRWLRDEESRITCLATYNSERARGIVHTDEWAELMAQEQEWFDQRQRDQMIAQGGVEVSPGIWHLPRDSGKRHGPRWFWR